MKKSRLTPEQAKELIKFYSRPKPLNPTEKKILSVQHKFSRGLDAYECPSLTIGIKSSARQSLLKHLFDKGDIGVITKLCARAKLVFREIKKYPGFKLFPAK